MIVPITPTIPIEEMMKPKKVRVKVPSADMDYEELQDFLYKQDQMHQKMIEEIDRQQKAAREKADKWVKELWIKGEATAYAPLLDEMNGESGITASGHDLRKSQTYKGYRVLASSKSIPFGTIVEIATENNGTFKGVVLDRGGAITQNKFDIAMATKELCMDFGRQQITYRIIGKVEVR